VRVQWLDQPTDHDFAAIAGVVNGFWREVLPDEPERPPSELAAAVREQPAHRTVSVAVAVDDGEIVGAAELVLDAIAGRDREGWVKYLVVDPARRSSGVGRALLAAVSDRARTAGRHRLTHAAAVNHAAGMAFAAASGATPALVNVQNRLRVEALDRAMLEAWVQRASQRASGYSLVAFDGDCADEWLEPIAQVTAVMNTAPRSDTTDDFVLTAEQVRENIDAFARQGNVMWWLSARDDATGELIGYTELAFSPYRPWLANQGDTAVHPDHRERGVGRWLKAVNALRLLDERPDVREIETWNADVNAAMLSINHAMGFRRVAEWQAWELDLI
jgi:GNAT superfamily N-acetyltransferase